MSLLTAGGWIACVAAVARACAIHRRLAARVLAEHRACHELRGALTAACLGLELEARAGRLAARRRRAIELELARAETVLDDLVHLPGRRRSSPGELEPIDLAELVADSVETWSAAASRQGGEVGLRLSGPQAVVVGRRARLAQITDNLIANALEHGEGPVQVSCSVENGRARVEVVDGGPGLAVPVAELVRRNRGRGARGHGLAIASAIAAEHGGRLAAAPSDGGARLVLELPTASGEIRAGAAG